MNPALFLILFLVFAVANAKTIKNKFVYKGKTDTLFSQILNEKRKIWMHVPKTAASINSANYRYPVVYLLDAEEHFKSFTDTIQQVDRQTGALLFPEMIVVGICNIDRARDLTPSHSMYNAKGKKDREFKSSGGGDKFIAFIEKELMPHVNSSYPVNDNRILIGHSLGGVAVMNVLLNHTTLFNNYIASDPSMWWDNKMMLDQVREGLQRHFEGKSLFLGIANTAHAGLTPELVRNSTSGSTNHMRSVLALADMLDSNPGNGLRADYKYYPNHNHDTVPIITRYDGMRFLLGTD